MRRARDAVAVSLASKGRADTVETSMFPVLLGQGGPMMSEASGHVKLKLVDTGDSIDGIIGLTWQGGACRLTLGARKSRLTD